MKRFYWGVAALVCAGPAPGDIGGCGQSAQLLDPVVFYLSEARAMCRLCTECDLGQTACSRSCEATELREAFPPGCFPLVHDGTVCLRALSGASCAEAKGLVEDDRAVPRECDFCPEDRDPQREENP